MKSFTRTRQFLSVKCLSQILLVVTSEAYNLKKKKKHSNYLNQSAIECTFQWLVLRLLSQQCFPRAKKPKGACAWLLKPRSQLCGKFACRNWVAGNTQDIILQACNDDHGSLQPSRLAVEMAARLFQSPVIWVLDRNFITQLRSPGF